MEDGPGAGAGGSDRFDGVRALIRARLAERALPSLAVAVVQDGRFLWEEAFGWADRDRRRAADPHTMYAVASISKPMTATALMVLVERGAADLDRPVNDYLGDAPLRACVGDAEAATVRRVAGHTSGLPVHVQFFYEDEPHAPPSRGETIRRYGRLMWAPGERYRYCNLGYGILDHVVARLGGRTYGDFMREEVFLPLGMTRAAVHVPERLRAYQAIRYGRDGVAYPHYGFDHDGGSAVFCSAHDLALFWAFHLKAHMSGQRAILTDASIDAMQQAPPAEDPGAGYGVGWALQPDLHGHRVVGHDGGMGGVETVLRLYPEGRLAVVALGNAQDPLPRLVADEVAAVLLPGYRERLQADRAESERAAAAGDRPEAQRGPEWEAPPELVGTWRGSVATYAGEMPLELRVRRRSGVQVRLGGQFWTLVNSAAFQGGWFTGEFAGQIDTEDARRRRHNLSFELHARDGVLKGAAVAVTRPDREGDGEGGSPGRRSGYALSHWTQLRREAEG